MNTFVILERSEESRDLNKIETLRYTQGDIPLLLKHAFNWKQDEAELLSGLHAEDQIQKF